MKKTEEGERGEEKRLRQILREPGGDICDSMNRYVTRREGETSNNKSVDKHIGN